MKLLRLWRQYNSIKATVLLGLLAAVLIGYCIRAAASYAVFLQTPTEYLCTAQDMDRTLRMFSDTEGVRAYSRQRTAYLAQEWQGCNVTLLSAAYLSDCWGLSGDARTVYMNPAAFAAMSGNANSPASFRGTLDGEPFSVQIICTDQLPQEEPFAVIGVDLSALHDADMLRICAANRDAFSPESLALTVTNRETLCAADYEQKMVLLRIRFGALAAVLALLGTAAFLRVYRDAVQSQI